MNHHAKINYEYDQDYINGITDDDYAVLFDFLKQTNKRKIVDLCGGTGELSLKLQNIGFDVTLMDIDERLLKIAKQKGVLKVKKLNLLKNTLPKTCVVIMKSAQHEFKSEYLELIHKKIFNSLEKGGLYFDWDSHVENKEQANFLLEFVNIKDLLSNDIHLVENRRSYFVKEIEKSLTKVGFNNVKIIHKFNYSISIEKFSKAYFKDSDGLINQNLKIDFFEKTRHLISENGVPKGIGCKIDESNKNIEFKFPAVIIKSEKQIE